MTIEQVRELFPNRAPNAKWTNEGDELKVTVERSPGRLASVISFFYKLPLTRTYLLDRFGAKVWNRCDGRTPACEIISAISRQTGWPEDRTERAVLQFLSMLSQRRLLGLSGKPGEHA